jgi:hypothetical protein
MPRPRSTLALCNFYHIFQPNKEIKWILIRNFKSQEIGLSLFHGYFPETVFTALTMRSREVEPRSVAFLLFPFYKDPAQLVPTCPNKRLLYRFKLFYRNNQLIKWRNIFQSTILKIIFLSVQSLASIIFHSDPTPASI